MESYKQLVINSSEESSSSSDCKTDKSKNEQLFNLRKKMCKHNVRQPTRRPDPNVFNRNALLARENRRRKKAQLEDMEKDLREMRKLNHDLVKLLKKEQRTVKKLEREKCYYRSVLKNQSEIRDLLSALNCRLPLTSHQKEGLVFNPPPELPELNKTPSVSISSSCSNTIVQEIQELTPISAQKDESYNHIMGEDKFLSSTCSSTCSELSFGLLSQYEPFSFLECDELQQGMDGMDMETSSVFKDHIDTTNFNEQNYVRSANDSEINENAEDVGICLHVKQGKITLEYCPHCDRCACLDKELDLTNIN